MTPSESRAKETADLMSMNFDTLGELIEAYLHNAPDWRVDMLAERIERDYMPNVLDRAMLFSTDDRGPVDVERFEGGYEIHRNANGTMVGVVAPAGAEMIEW